MPIHLVSSIETRDFRSITYLAGPPGSGGHPIVLYRYGSSATPWNV